MNKLIACALAAPFLIAPGLPAVAQVAASGPAARPVGVSASTAARAQAKAASDSDTGTLVRTGPSATQDARHVAHHAERSASSATRHHTRHARAAASSSSE